MNETSAFPAEHAEPARPATTASIQVLVWDVPVRVFHWLTVMCFAGAYLTAESEHWRLLHVTLGYTMAGLVAFRIAWGFVGTRHARFASFVRGPAAVLRYLRSMRGPRPEHPVGHNPLGALDIVALLALALAVTASGWATYSDLGGHWLEEAHELMANGMLLLVGVHVLGVLSSSRLHRENLVAAMITGRKPGRPEDGIRHAWQVVGALMLAAVLGFWWLQWQGAPAKRDASGTSAAAEAGNAARRGKPGHQDHDD